MKKSLFNFLGIVSLILAGVSMFIYLAFPNTLNLHPIYSPMISIFILGGGLTVIAIFAEVINMLIAAIDDLNSHM